MTARALPVSAAGKLFVLGEYAVLGGGPALVTAVNRKVHVRPRRDDGGYLVEGATFDDPLRLPVLVRQVLAEYEGIEVDLNSITVDLSEFYSDKTKLGIGSSAASTVALIASLAPHLSAKRRFELAWKVHHRLQDGRGSGADIAASTFGGTVAFHLRERSAPFDALDLGGLPNGGTGLSTGTAFIDADLAFPDDLRVDAVWTGKSARSVSFVAGLEKTYASQPEATAAVLKSIASRARVGIQALHDDDSELFVDTVRKADRAMERLGDLTHLPIITDTHRRIRALAHTTNSVAKPSGAGGGDFTLLVSPRDGALPRPIVDDYLILSVH